MSLSDQRFLNPSRECMNFSGSSIEGASIIRTVVTIRSKHLSLVCIRTLNRRASQRECVPSWKIELVNVEGKWPKAWDHSFHLCCMEMMHDPLVNGIIKSRIPSQLRQACEFQQSSQSVSLGDNNNSKICQSFLTARKSSTHSTFLCWHKELKPILACNHFGLPYHDDDYWVSVASLLSSSSSSSVPSMSQS